MVPSLDFIFLAVTKAGGRFGVLAPLALLPRGVTPTALHRRRCIIVAVTSQSRARTIKDSKTDPPTENMAEAFTGIHNQRQHAATATTHTGMSRVGQGSRRPAVCCDGSLNT